MSMKTRKLSYGMGAEIIGVDIARPLTEEAFQEIYQALLQHCVLLFRGIPLTNAQYAAFGRRFGKLHLGQSGHLSDFPEIKPLIAKPKGDGKPLDANFSGSDWHSDMTFKPTPIIITMLKAVALPEVGGDTQFANLHMAYDTLSDAMKKMLEGLEGVHMEQETELDHSSPENLEASRRAKTTAHPLVKVHPETGRKLLYVNDKVRLVAGMTAEESEPLLNFLRNHTQRSHFIYRHMWQKDDLIVWDQRSTNHNAMGNYDRRNELRHLDKITMFANQPTGRPYDESTHIRNLTQAFALQ